MSMTLMILFFIVTCLCQRHYNPHTFDSSHPSFEGWYTRITSTDKSSVIQSVGVLFGSYPVKPSAMNGSAAILSLFYSVLNDDVLKTVSISLSDLHIREGQCGGQEISSNESPCFTLQLHEKYAKGTVVIGSERQTYDLSLIHSGLKYTLYAEMAEAEFWDENAKGPLKELYDFPIKAPQYWYVFSTASKTLFTLTINGHSFSGLGLAHMEKNWGNSFPKEWIWAQYSDNDTQLVLAGGDTGFAISTPNMYMMLLRIKKDDSVIDLKWGPFDAILPSHLDVKISRCRNEILVASSANGYNIDIKFKTTEDSYQWFDCPTADGFKPFSIESFSSTVEITMMKGSHVVHNQIGNGAAMEFGGQWTQC